MLIVLVLLYAMEVETMNNREKNIYNHLNRHPYYRGEAWVTRTERLQRRYPKEFKAVLERLENNRIPG
jgi:hypothetical protein